MTFKTGLTALLVPPSSWQKVQLRYSGQWKGGGGRPIYCGFCFQPHRQILPLSLMLHRNVLRFTLLLVFCVCLKFQIILFVIRTVTPILFIEMTFGSPRRFLKMNAGHFPTWRLHHPLRNCGGYRKRKQYRKI